MTTATRLADIAEKDFAAALESSRLRWFVGKRHEGPIRRTILAGCCYADAPSFREMAGSSPDEAELELREYLKGWVSDTFDGWAFVLQLLLPLIIQVILRLLTKP